ncbi:MAG TPA: hypothetical protein ENH53_03060 [Bacteroidetes bacterium]|nr:hypothetical protein [Bacteroidota bacterium]
MTALFGKSNNLMRMRTWYGMTAVIEIRNRSLHRAGFGRVLIPHPPAVNWLLRFGLSDDPYYKLSTIHEFGHFQTLPAIAVYSFAALGWVLATHRASLIGIIALLIGIHATWEMLAELVVRFHTGPLYTRTYTGISVIPRIIFWSAAAAISIGGWAILLH